MTVLPKVYWQKLRYDLDIVWLFSSGSLGDSMTMKHIEIEWLFRFSTKLLLRMKALLLFIILIIRHLTNHPILTWLQANHPTNLLVSPILCFRFCCWCWFCCWCCWCRWFYCWCWFCCWCWFLKKCCTLTDSFSLWIRNFYSVYCLYYTVYITVCIL